MGNININLNVKDNIAKLDVVANNPTVYDLSVAVTQIELLKLNLLSKVARGSKIGGKVEKQKKE